MTELKETHYQGNITIENISKEPPKPGFFRGDIGIQISKDGRVWICINGLAFIRLSPHLDGKMSRKTN